MKLLVAGSCELMSAVYKDHVTSFSIRAFTGIAAGAVVLASSLASPAEGASSAVQAKAASQIARGYSVPSKATSLGQVNRLRVAAPASMAGYSRDKFPHWRDASAWGWPVAPSNACDVRSAALYRDGSGVKINTRCTVTAGRWLDSYTATTITTKASMDVDHVVPLAAAWRAGAKTWTAKRRTQFANDKLALVSVQSSANRSKGDKTPDLWKPPNKAAWCLYAKRYTSIKTSYAMTTTASEKTALITMLNTCAR